MAVMFNLKFFSVDPAEHEGTPLLREYHSGVFRGEGLLGHCMAVAGMADNSR